MTNIADLYNNPDDPNGRTPVEGIVYSAPSGTTDLLNVVVPSFDSDQVWQLRWMPRGSTLPAPGDHCLVVFTKDGTAWASAWWPGS
jgi:hypothetical protein